MTLEETIRTLEAVALQQQSVAMVIDNDIFKLNTIPNAKYAVFAYTQGEHLTSVSGDLATYRLTLFYVDRLLADKSNQTQIQSTGTQVLRNILTMMSELDFQVDNMPIQPFTQQFVDECAGVYCAVAIGAANGCECMPGFAEVLRKLNAATDKANTAADRAAALADNPPKIVLNDQGYFWAFYDEDTKQYVVSEYPARGEKGDTGDQGPKGDTPVLTAQSDGTILSDGVVLTDVLKVAAENSDTQTARVEELADNPPKIVEVEGAKYWAFWDEATGQYVPSENRADVGDAVLFSPQTLTDQQQEQARANINVEKSGSAYNISKICNLNPFVLNWSNLPGYSSNHAFKNIFIKGNYIYAQKKQGTLSGGIQKFDTAGNSIAADHNDWYTDSHFQIFLVKGDFLYGIRNKNSIVKLNVSDLSIHSNVSYSFTNENAIYQLGDKIIVFNNSSIYEMDEDTLDMRLIDTISDVRFAYIGQTRNNLIIVTDTTAYEYDDNYQILNQRDLPSNFSGSNLKWVAPKGKLSYDDEGIIILNTSNKITFLYFSYGTPSDTGVQIPTEYLFDNSVYEISGIFMGTIDYDTSYILAPRGFLLELYGSVGRPYAIRKTIPLRYNTNGLNANAGGNSDRLACACSIPNVILL